MNVEVRHKPSFATIFVTLEEGESVRAEAEAMASMSANTKVATRFNGGVFLAFLLRFFGGESMFVNTFTARGGPVDLVLTQATPGDVHEIELAGNTVFLQPGAYIASTGNVKVGVQWAGFASFIGGEGLFRLKLSGHGKVWIGAYGSIFEREITSEYVVDTGHLVGYDPSIALSVGMAGGIFSSLFSGEGLITRVRGPGKIYLQSRSVDGLVSWTNGHLY